MFSVYVGPRLLLVWLSVPGTPLGRPRDGDSRTLRAAGLGLGRSIRVPRGASWTHSALPGWEVGGRTREAALRGCGSSACSSCVQRVSTPQGPPSCWRCGRVDDRQERCREGSGRARTCPCGERCADVCRTQQRSSCPLCSPLSSGSRLRPPLRRLARLGFHPRAPASPRPTPPSLGHFFCPERAPLPRPWGPGTSRQSLPDLPGPSEPSSGLHWASRTLPAPRRVGAHTVGGPFVPRGSCRAGGTRGGVWLCSGLPHAQHSDPEGPSLLGA